MKKSFLTIIITMSIVLASFAQSYAWTFVNGGLVFIPGVTYSVNICLGSESSTTVKPIPGDPFSFVICDGESSTANFYTCSAGSAFNPTTFSCDIITNVKPLYPNFPWADYGY